MGRGARDLKTYRGSQGLRGRRTSTRGDARSNERRVPHTVQPAAADLPRGEVAHRSGPATKATRKLADGFEQLIERQSHASRADTKQGRSRQGRFRRADFCGTNRIQIDVQAAKQLQAFDDPLAAVVVVFARERVLSEHEWFESCMPTKNLAMDCIRFRSLPQLG